MGAWVESVNGERQFHVRRISSREKYAMNKDSTNMTATDDGKDYFMLSSKDHKGRSSFKWCQFVECSLKRISKRDCSGYWNILPDADEQRLDLNLLQHLVMPKAFNMVSMREGEFTVKVYFHGEDVTSDRMYNIVYCNHIGKGEGLPSEQCTAFQLRRGDSEDTEYYLYCNTLPRDDHVEWQWYDNNSATYKKYGAGPEVDAQLEVSFQANFHFPASIGHYFSNVNFNALTNAVAAESGENSRRRRKKQFLLRFRFVNAGDGVHREMLSAEQITVHPRPYCTFPRVIRRTRIPQDTSENYIDSEQNTENSARRGCDLEF